MRSKGKWYLIGKTSGRPYIVSKTRDKRAWAVFIGYENNIATYYIHPKHAMDKFSPKWEVFKDGKVILKGSTIPEVVQKIDQMENSYKLGENMKKLSINDLKQIIKEEMDKPYGMGTGGAPMQGGSDQSFEDNDPIPQDDDFSMPEDDGFDSYGSNTDPGLDGLAGSGPSRYSSEEMNDTFEESFKIPSLQQLDERSGMDPVATQLRNALNDCANLAGNIVQVITRKKPEWKEALQAVRQAEEALDNARQALMSHG